jgi:hypothetical protein
MIAALLDAFDGCPEWAQDYGKEFAAMAFVVGVIWTLARGACGG